MGQNHRDLPFVSQFREINDNCIGESCLFAIAGSPTILFTLYHREMIMICQRHTSLYHAVDPATLPATLPLAFQGLCREPKPASPNDPYLVYHQHHRRRYQRTPNHQ